MSDDRTHYDVLGVARTASTDEITAAYRRHVARLRHVLVRTDNNTDDPDAEDLRRVNEAGEVLRDGDRRLRYDLELAAAGSTPPAGHYPSPGSARPGDDLLCVVQVPLSTAIAGGEQIVEVRRPNAPPVKVRVRVPEGAEIGDRWRIAGQGQPGSPPGDLIVQLGSYQHDVVFVRVGDDLHADLEVTLADVYAGASVMVPGPREPIALRLTAGTLPPLVRIAGEGWRRRDRVGDLVLRVRLRWPPAGNAALLRALRAAYSRR